MSIDPKEFIFNLPSLQQYECMVCFEIQINMMRCSGPCKGKICLNCASNYSRQGGQSTCPKRCSSPLRLEPIPTFNPQFYCPFAAQKCQGRLMNLEEFTIHCRQCQEIPIEIVEQNIRKDEYLCSKGHPLLFLNTAAIVYAFNSINQTCHCNSCGVKQSCPSFCYKCSQLEERVVFCNRCRVLPCTRDVCPIGHALQRVQVESRNFTCDLCGHCIIIFSQFSYSDRNCNFDICERCYQTLPEYHPRVPIQENLNFMNQFGMMHKLASLMANNEENENQGQGQQENYEPAEQEEGGIVNELEQSQASDSNEDYNLLYGEGQNEEPEQGEQGEQGEEENGREWSASESGNSQQEEEQIQQMQIEQPLKYLKYGLPPHEAIKREDEAEEDYSHASFEQPLYK